MSLSASSYYLKKLSLVAYAFVKLTGLSNLVKVNAKSSFLLGFDLANKI